jgi:uncharacterized protein DUF4154
MKLFRNLLIVFIFISISSFGQEAKYKSVFIYNFTKHFEWPVSYRTGNFVIGVIGNPVIISELENITSNKKAGSQPIVIEKFKDETAIGKCHILFVPSNKSKNMGDIVAKIGSNPTLIVTEKDGMAQQGAGINFIIQAGKIKFELNKANAAKQGLKISSYLETLAILVN